MPMRSVPSEYRLKSVTVSQAPSGKYYASILFEYEDQVQEKEMQKFLGLDFSMHELYRDSNGKEPAYPGYYRNAEKKLAREQRKPVSYTHLDVYKRQVLSCISASSGSLSVSWKVPGSNQ